MSDPRSPRHSGAGRGPRAGARRARRGPPGRALAAALLAVALLAPAPAAAQFFNDRDDKYVLLGLKRAREAFEVARKELARQEELFARGLVPESQIDVARRTFSEAEVNYQQSMLAVLFEEQYVAVRAAVKRRDATGRSSVRLRLENTAGGGAELRHLAGMEDELFASLAPDRIHDVYVSLLDDAGAIVSQPYEAKIEELVTGRPADLDFGLLRDLDAVTVALNYGNGNRRSVKVFLQRDEREDRVSVRPLQFSQEGELGSAVSFDLALELYSGSDDTYRLAVLNLPPEVHATFTDPDSEARLRQIRFDGGAETRRARLSLELPDRPSERLPLGAAQELLVAAVPERRVASLGDLEGRAWSPAELDAAGIGWARLELLARGAGRLQVVAPQLFQRSEGAAPVTVAVDLRNDGSGELRNVALQLEPPLGWRRRIEPALVPVLGVGAEQRVVVTLEPPADVPSGRYESRLESRALADGKPIDGEDKLLTVEIAAPVSLAGTVGLLGAILGVVGGLVVFGVKLTRR